MKTLQLSRQYVTHCECVAGDVLHSHSVYRVLIYVYLCIRLRNIDAVANTLPDDMI